MNAKVQSPTGDQVAYPNKPSIPTHMKTSSVLSPKQVLISGAIWTVGTRWFMKGLGFLNTVIMARLLVPADYGIVAMAMLVVGLIQALLDFGATTALLRKGEVMRDEIDSAWTLRMLQSVGVGLLLLIASPLAAAYFKEPRVEYVLWVLAACVALAGAGNIGLTLAQKEFNFVLEFRIQVICKSLGVLVTVAAGYVLRDYRALVLGVATGYISGFILTYWLHPYRPRWNTSKIGDIWGITKWLMLAGVGGFILRKGDEIMAGRIGTAAQFGLYNVGADLGQLPTGEVGPAMLRAFLPVLAAMRGGADEINGAVLKTVAAVNTITLPMGFGFAAVALPATHLILGPTWSGAAQYVAAFAIASTLQIMQSPFSTLLLMRGHTKVQSHAVWLEFAVFLIAAVALVPTFFLIGLVWARMLGSVANLGATLLATRRYCGIPLKSAAKTVMRPLLGAAGMYLLVQTIVDHVQGDAWQLGLGISCGAVAFTVWSVFSWQVTGRPPGLESTVHSFIGNRHGRGNQ
ncbi:MAG: lipopolysaccharide biosynthesis protein [Polaromonas sp.]